MEKLNFPGELTHRFLLTDEHSKTPDCAILISIFFKHWMMTRNIEFNFKNPLIKLCEDKRYNYLKNLADCFDYIKNSDYESFEKSINQLSQYFKLFEDIKIYRKSAKLDSKLNLVSKYLDIVIILKDRINEKIYFCGSSRSPMTIHIVYENLKYFPGIHREEYSFIKNLSLDSLDRFPFKMTQEKFANYKKTSIEKIKVIMNSLKNSIGLLKQESVNELTNFLQNTPSLGIDQSTLNEFLGCLKSGGKCKDHQTATFPCGNIHCLECTRGKQRCICDVAFKFEDIQKNLKQVTTYYKPTPFKIAPPPQGLTSPQIPQTSNNPHGIASNQIVNFAQNNPAYSPYSQNLQLNPNFNSGQGNQIIPPLNKIGDISHHYPHGQNEGQARQCWTCNQPDLINNGNLCNGGHFLCQSCQLRSFGICSQCENLNCLICGDFMLRGDASIYLGYYYHPPCLEQRISLF